MRFIIVLLLGLGIGFAGALLLAPERGRLTLPQEVAPHGTRLGKHPPGLA